MNRSILSVVLGGFGGEQSVAAGSDNSDKLLNKVMLKMLLIF